MLLLPMLSLKYECAVSQVRGISVVMMYAKEIELDDRIVERV